MRLEREYLIWGDQVRDIESVEDDVSDMMAMGESMSRAGLEVRS